MAEQGFRITYATMSADNEELHRLYDKGIEVARSWLGEKHSFHVNGEDREGSGYEEVRSPIDREMVIGKFAQATREDVRDAVAAAKAYSYEWANAPWQERVALVRAAADLISERRYELSALMAMEVGKSRLEALGDVEESADLLRWNCNEMEKHDGFVTTMQSLGSPGQYYDVLRPYGVWGVISPFNFPMALAAGPSSGALVAGNCVVFKPAHLGVFTGLKLYEVYRDAGVPPGAFHCLSGSGGIVGDEIMNHPDVGGITFTGSYEVGMGIYKGFAKDFPKPAICEMGGKNPTIVTEIADLDKATDGVLRSAFGFGGQKCSACSRVYVHRSVHDQFIQLLKEKTEKVKIGNPLDKDVYLGPVVDEHAVATFEEATAEAKRGGTVVVGGERLTEGDLARGYFVQPTVVEVPLDSWIWRKELFVPFVAVAAYEDLDEAIRMANESEYGLTAGFYSEDKAQIDKWMSTIEAGVIYVNRRAGATTGAWPGVQPFGGWKASGTTGKAGGGPYYVTQYMREQSRTVIEE
ncbi:MAG: aldehyde dehydrogenase family protein [Actinomycetota bacterium]